MNNLINLCPICINNSAEYYTECGHNYCIDCLSRIKKCALCRKQLLKAKLCIEINSQNKTTQTYEVYVINYSSALILLRGLEELSVWRGVTYSN
jgi:hypothetical protein